MISGGLKDLVRKSILEDVLVPLHNKGEWKVLVVDQLGMKIVSACLKMKDILDNGITLIEDLSKARQPLPYLEAIYFVKASKENIMSIKGDVTKSNGGYDVHYKAAHLFFTQMISDDLITDLAHSDMAPFIQTIKEVNLAFLPVEERVFSLDGPESYKFYSSENPMSEEEMDHVAEQLVTVCATLEETPCPKVRICNSNLPIANKLAAKVQAKLNTYKEAGILTDNSKSQLIILDRGFDPISPFLHELTFQAMAYDLLSSISPEKNTYTDSEDESKKIILDENNELWRELRHLHISNVLDMLPQKLKALSERYADLHGGMGKDLTEMKDMINKMPQYKKEKALHESIFKLAEECFHKYKNGNVERVVFLEQDLAMGVDSQDRPIDDYMKSCVHVFVPQSGSPVFTPYQKLRVLILYVLNKAESGKPLNKDTLARLIEKADITNEEKAIYNLALLGINIFGTADIPKREVPPRIRQVAKGSFETSRWTPVVQDIMESLVHDGNLDTKYYPYVASETQSSNNVDHTVASARRYGQGRTAAIATRTSGPKLIIYVMGSISYSEMRCAHLVSEARTRSRMEIIIGSDNILTPEQYLDKLLKLT